VLLRWGATFSLMHKSNWPCNRVVSQWQAAAANRQPLPTHLRGTPPLFAPPTASTYHNQLSLSLITGPGRRPAALALLSLHYSDAAAAAAAVELVLCALCYDAMLPQMPA